MYPSSTFIRGALDVENEAVNEFITGIGIMYNLYTFSVQGWFPFIFCIDTTYYYKILRVIFPNFFGLQDFVIWGSRSNILGCEVKIAQKR